MAIFTGIYPTANVEAGYNGVTGGYAHWQALALDDDGTTIVQNVGSTGTVREMMAMDVGLVPTMQSINSIRQNILGARTTTAPTMTGMFYRAYDGATNTIESAFPYGSLNATWKDFYHDWLTAGGGVPWTDAHIRGGLGGNFSIGLRNQLQTAGNTIISCYEMWVDGSPEEGGYVMFLASIGPLIGAALTLMDWARLCRMLARRKVAGLRLRADERAAMIREWEAYRHPRFCFLGG